MTCTALPVLLALLALTGPAQAQFGSTYCSSLPNTTGRPAELVVTGSPRVEDNQLRIDGQSLPPFSFGYFLVSQDAGVTGMPGGSAGVLCLSGNIGRYDRSVLQASAAGQVDLSFDLGRIPHPVLGYGAESGDTLYFQYWFRDSTPLGAPTSNFSSGVRVDFACDAVDFAVGTTLHPFPWTDRRQAIAADFDGDGRIDFAAPGFSTNEIVVSLNQGGGDFSPPVVSPTTSTTAPFRIAPADVDHDGDVDLLGLNGSELLVFLNNGRASFTFHASTPTPTQGYALQVVDLDLDGWTDAVIPRGSGLVSTVFMGPGGFPGLLGQADVGIPHAQVAVVDLDGDTLEDLLVTSSGGDRFVWLKNLGNRFFSNTVNLPPVPGSNFRGQVIDIDADGDQDLWYWRRFPAAEGTMLNDGTGTFTPGPSLGLNPDTFTVAREDLDADGDDDLLSLDWDAGDELTVALQTAPGVFAPMAPVELPFPIRRWVLADFTGDGTSDLGFQPHALYIPGFSILENDRSGDFTPHQPPTLNGKYSYPSAADWNGDGREDLLYSNTTGIGVIENNGSTPAPGVSIPGATDPTLGSLYAALDLDGDGDLDLMSRPFAGLQPLLADGMGSISVGTRIQLFPSVKDLVLADVTGDGLPDIVNVHQTNNTYRLQVIRNVGGGSFTVHANQLISSSPTRAAAGDIDGDGALDLVLLSESSQEVQIYLNGGGGSDFNAVMSLPVNSAFSGTGNRPLLKDFDRDGDIDILISQRGASVGLGRLFMNTGNGSFMAGVDFWPGLPPTAMTARDMDRDGALDLVFSSSSSPAWSVLLNDGAGNFGAPMAWLGVGTAHAALPVDINGDGTVDLLSFRIVSATTPAALGIHFGSCR